MKKIWLSIKAWWWAHTTSCAVWRVKYPDGRRIYHLPYSEAKSCQKMWGGKLYIDYKYAKNIVS